MQKFYRVQLDTPALGPFYANASRGMLNAWGFRSVDGNTKFPGAQARRMLIEGGLRGKQFPGVMKPERPARGWLNCPAQADITNHSTLTMNDGENVVVFEFVKSGSPTPGNEEVDISTAVTGSDVAEALGDAIAAWVISLGLPPQGGGPGFSSFQNGAELKIIQAFPGKNFRGTGQLWKLTWMQKTMGALGNHDITPSVAGEWTGRIRHMSGGKARKPGCLARAALGQNQTLQSFYPVIAPSED